MEQRKNEPIKVTAVPVYDDRRDYLVRANKYFFQGNYDKSKKMLMKYGELRHDRDNLSEELNALSSTPEDSLSKTLVRILDLAMLREANDGMENMLHARSALNRIVNSDWIHDLPEIKKVLQGSGIQIPNK